MTCSFVGFLEETNQPEPARHTIDSKLPFPCGAPQILEDLMKIQATVAHSATRAAFSAGDPGNYGVFMKKSRCAAQNGIPETSQSEGKLKESSKSSPCHPS
ncbi:hypothetical protein [Kocuria marina]|uniref:hypothetical protein n=1 Tax=Kocuria TaxID=57493 RepID=UPI0018765339